MSKKTKGIPQDWDHGFSSCGDENPKSYLNERQLALVESSPSSTEVRYRDFCEGTVIDGVSDETRTCTVLLQVPGLDEPDDHSSARVDRRRHGRRVAGALETNHKQGSFRQPCRTPRCLGCDGASRRRHEPRRDY